MLVLFMLVLLLYYAGHPRQEVADGRRRRSGHGSLSRNGYGYIHMYVRTYVRTYRGCQMTMTAKYKLRMYIYIYIYMFIYIYIHI